MTPSYKVLPRAHSGHLVRSGDGAGGSPVAAILGPMPEWDLSDLYTSPDAPEVARDLKAGAAEAKRIKETYQSTVADCARDGAKLAEAVKSYEALSDLLGKLGSYAGLYYAANQADAIRAKFYGDVSEALTRIVDGPHLFRTGIEPDRRCVLAEAVKAPALVKYKPWLEDLRRKNPISSRKRSNALFTEKGQTGRAAFNRLFSETMTALRFNVEGEQQPLTLEPTLNLLSNASEPKRKAAAAALAKVFGDNIRLFTLITNTLAKDKEISDRWRGFKDVADSRHLANRVEAPVVEALVSSVRAAYPRLSHRYYAMKAKWLGIERMSHWDRNAPLPDKPERIFTWAEAQATVLKAYGAFAPDMAATAKQFFDKGWIDAPVREGKAQGAFSASTVPSVHPYVLMNYQGKPRDVMTLAHELGHGVHQMLARDQGPLLAPTPLTLAETASVFGEMLTFKALLAETKDAKKRRR